MADTKASPAFRTAGYCCMLFRKPWQHTNKSYASQSFAGWQSGPNIRITSIHTRIRMRACADAYNKPYEKITSNRWQFLKIQLQLTALGWKTSINI